MPRTYSLTPAMVAAHGGGPVVCLAASAMGAAYALHDDRPGPERNERITRAAVVGPSGIVAASEPLDMGPTLTRVDIRGPIEQRAGYHDCGGWADGHDAIAERLCAALADGDVLLVIDSPGGAHAGLVEAVRRVVACKAELGRRVTVYADEMIGSAAYWWAAVVGDEIYSPESGIVGSVGARSSHYSEAAHLASEGVAVTYFAWPGEGKVAFAPELPLSDIGRARGERDVAIAGEAFAEAVATSRGLTRDTIVALDADALYGPLAVAAGLVDGVASFDEVLAMALDYAGASRLTETPACDDDAAPMSDRMGARARGDIMTIRAESGEGTEPSPACAKCGSANEINSKFCDQCGESMAAKPMAAEEPAEPPAEEPEPPPAEEAEEPSDPEKPSPPKPPVGKAAAPAMGPKASASIASMLGLHANASAPAIKSAILPLVALAQHAVKLTGVRDAAEAVGALSALAADAAEVGALRSKLATAQSAANARERLDLLKQLAASGAHPRGELLEDIVEGDRVVGVRPAKLWGPGPEGRTLANLRGYVRTKLAAPTSTASDLAPTAAAKPSPYQPDPTRASAVHVTDRDREIAQSGGYDPAAVAASRAALFPTNGATRQGV